jgi:hypothetical protein
MVKNQVSPAIVEALGRARGEAGVGLAETLADLRAAASVSAALGSFALPPDHDQSALGSGQIHLRLNSFEAAAAVAVGWADGAALPPASQAWLDPVTGLAWVAHLELAIGELYRRHAARGGPPPAETHRLLVAETAVDCPDPWSRLERGALLGQTMREVCDAGQTVASLGPASGAAAVLTERDPWRWGPGAESVARALRRRLERHLRPLQTDGAARHPVRVSVWPLPASATEAVALLRRVAR